MGLYRKNRASPRFRRTVAGWTSVGVIAALCVALLVGVAVDTFTLHSSMDGALYSNGEPRQLGNLIKEDPLIDSPVRHAKNKGWVVVHIIIIGYMLLGLNTVCDAYFTGALDQMVNQWKVKPDVAGATFMAAGGSAPELFTSLIGTNVSENDVGFGTIVGSAVFNVLFVIGLCGFAAKEAIHLTWWPLFRDCTYYIFGLTMLAIFSKTNNEVELWEAFVLFLGYVGYCVIMYFNPVLEDKFLNNAPDGQDKVTRLDKVAPVADTGSTSATGADAVEVPHHIRVAQPKFNRSQTQTHGPAHGSNDASCEAKRDSGPKTTEQEAIGENDEEDEEEDDIEALLIKPEDPVAQFVWYLSLPIYAMLYYCIPKPTDSQFLRTFTVSLMFIGGFSLFLVYCVEILGEVLHIHVIVMGFTLLAAGTSIPDAVSSVAVARAGEGDMAVSSSIGSNIFDILVGLPIPWMVKIVFVDLAANGIKGSTVKIQSEYIVLYVLILIVMVFCVVLSIHCLGWVLNRTLGIGMALLYAVFLLIVLVVEFSRPEALKF